MNVNTVSWEGRLLDMAVAGIGSAPHAPDHHVTTQELIRAYAHCSAITNAHSRTFYLASGLLPPQKRDGARALYAFCRTADDLVDRQAEHTTADARAALTEWRRHATDVSRPPDDGLLLAWAHTQATYNIPGLYAEQLIDGVSRDLDQDRYATFADLSTYCYGVASTVGLMAMHIIGFSSIEAIPYAVKLGIALQLTNILRDLAQD